MRFYQEIQRKNEKLVKDKKSAEALTPLDYLRKTVSDEWFHAAAQAVEVEASKNKEAVLSTPGAAGQTDPASTTTTTSNGKVKVDGTDSKSLRAKARTMAWALTYYVMTDSTKRPGLRQFQAELKALPRDVELDGDAQSGSSPRPSA